MAPTDKSIEVAPAVDDPRAVALLQALGFDKLSTGQRELALSIASRYDLDPMLKHLVMIEGRVYITRDGLLHVAHRSGHFDGIEVDPPESDGTYYRTIARVYRKDFSRPFSYPGRYPIQGRNRQYAEEMAIKVAEVMTLRRAFDVSAPAYEERWSSDNDVDAAALAEEPQSLTDRIAARAESLADKSLDPEDRLMVATLAVTTETVASSEVPEERLIHAIEHSVDAPSTSAEDDAEIDAVVALDEPETPSVAGAEATEISDESETDETSVPETVSPLRPSETVATETTETDESGMSYTEFMEAAKDFDRDVVRKAAKFLYPGRTKFADMTPAEREHVIISLRATATPTSAPVAAPVVDAPLADPFHREPPTADFRGGPFTGETTVSLCGARSPFSDATCTLDSGHRVPIANGVNHRSGVREAW